MSRLFGLCLVLSVNVVVNAGSFAEEAELKWGHLKGGITLKGDIPKLEPYIKTGDPKVKDSAICAAKELPDTSLVVDSSTNGVAHVAVYLQKAPMRIHPEFAKASLKEIEMRATGCRYEPHMLFARVGQKIRIKSEDSIGHNHHVFSVTSPQFCFVVRPNDPLGELHEMRFAERLPARVGCDIHPWMTAYWLVLDHPYAAITGKDGTFQIKDLPTGEHEFRVWQERIGHVDKVVHRVTIKADETTTLDLVIPVEKLVEQK